MSGDEWLDFTEGFNYKKQFYDVLLPSGEIVLACWPNAGAMSRTWGHGPGIPERYTHADGIKVRPALDDRPWRRKEPND